LLFNSLEFAAFLAVVLALYGLLPHRAQNRLLLVASYAFYAAWDWRFLGLIATSTLVDYAVALGISRSRDARRRRALLVLSVATNLGILGYFKYAGFFSEALGDLLAALGLSVPRLALDVVLPVGISFYTFQSLSYTVDVYRGEVEPTRDPLDFALYVAFFPQLVAGPIERGRRLLPQVLRPRRVTRGALASGAWLILWGTYKKVVVADNLAAVVDAVYAPGSDPVGAEVLAATYAFAFQIYCDFSGYTDVARGVARLMGFELMKNFDLPYLATSPADLWRRWHISLSTWLRDYLYVPLGGNRGGVGRTYRNLLLTMLLGGLWHGAAWTFVAWGAFHGAALCAHRALRGRLERVAPASARGRAAWWALRVVATFHLTCFSWLLFRAASLGDVGRLLASPWGEAGRVGDWLLPGAVLVGPLLAMWAWQARRRDPEVVLGAPFAVRVLVYAGLGLGIILLGEDGGAPFIYFQF